jgi:hypothetical protein
MDPAFVFALITIGACVWGILLVRSDRSVEREEEVTIVQNLSSPRNKARPSLAYLLPLSPPVVLAEDTGKPDPSIPLENILVSQEYPLIPFRKHGPWIPPRGNHDRYGKDQ